MTKNDMLLLIKVNDEIYKIYDSFEGIFGDVSSGNLAFQHFTDMILEYTHTKDDEIKRMWEILIDRSMSVVEGAEKVGRDWLIPNDVERPVDGRITSGEYKNWRKQSK